MKRTIVLGILLGVAAVSMAAAFQAQPAPGPNVAGIEKVKDNLYMITGGGGNTAAFITQGGVVVVDTKLDNWGQAILDKIKTVTNKPVTMIVNTHTHGDHVGSNDEFPASVVEIVAHESTKANMEKMPAFQPAEKKKFLPGRTFKDKLSLLQGNDRVDLYYFGRGHTNGDAIIVFPALRTAHTGDLFAFTTALPIIDVNNGGSGVEYPRTIAKAADGIPGIETVIPGHSAVTDWKAFRTYGEFMQAFVTAVETAKKAGQTADQAAGALKLPPPYASYDIQQRGKAAVAALYGELK
jgi:glyoxylase-like metal-dependent hydrolase (beta-lactamase superfamily II)